MNIVTVKLIGTSRDKEFDRLHAVFIKSLRQHLKVFSCSTIIERGTDYKTPDRKCYQGSVDNTVKLNAWTAIAHISHCNVTLCDCDMLCQGDFSEVFEADFDIGYTTRTKEFPPVNGGVVFVKNSIEAKQFMTLWAEVNQRMLDNLEFHEEYRARYTGMNQASFGYMFEHPHLYKAKLKSFPCRVYNSCSDDWEHSAQAKLIHINNHLRNDLLENKHIEKFPKETERIAREWYQYI